MHHPNCNNRYGVYFGPDDPRNISERLEGSLQTNNRAELTAILKALDVSVCLIIAVYINCVKLYVSPR